MIEINTQHRILTAIGLVVLCFLMIKYDLILIYSLILFGVLSLLEFLKITKKIFSNKFYNYFLNAIFIIYIFLFSYFFSFFSSNISLKIILFIFLFSCVASDIGGFVFGKTFGGRKITKISPNKTFSGALGSVIFTYIFMSLAFFLYNENISYKIFILSIFTSISCQVGDLFFSYLKRKANIKDTGSFLPGHGGILDRIDGILFGVPIGCILHIYFN